MSQPTALPGRARIVIIGGGCVGASIAYHLASLGQHDTVLLEANQLTSGSTWHAAGVVGRFKTSATLTELLSRSVATFQQVETETGLSTGWTQQGSLRIACSKLREIELLRAVDLAPEYGLEMRIVSTDEVAGLFPGVTVDDVRSAAFVPADGVVNPTDLTQALAKGARLGGVRIEEGVRVERLDCDHTGRITGVTTDRGPIECEICIVTTGIWAREQLAPLNVHLPLIASYHQYLVTEPIDGMRRDAPFLRDPDSYSYAKEEVGGLVIGCYETDPVESPQSLAPALAGFQLGEDNNALIEAFTDRWVHRFPALAETGIRNIYNGLESFTPDGKPLVGPVGAVGGLFVAAGFNANGVALSGGVGHALARWVVEGHPGLDLRILSPDRFNAFSASTHQTRVRSLEGQGMHYAPNVLGPKPRAGRPWRTSSVHAVFAGDSAMTEERDGWETIQVAQTPRSSADPIETHLAIMRIAAAELAHCRQAAVAFDATPAVRYLLTAEDWDAIGRRVAFDSSFGWHAAALDDDGGILAPLRVWPLSDDLRLVCAPASSADPLDRWLSPHGGMGAGVRNDGGFCELHLVGPTSASLLDELWDAPDQSVAPQSDTDITRRALNGAEVWVENAPTGAQPGRRILVRSEFALGVLQRLLGGAPTLRLGGHIAYWSLKAQAAGTAWGFDIGPGDAPDAGRTPDRVRYIVESNEESLFLGGEPVCAGGATIGLVSAVVVSLETGHPAGLVQLAPEVGDPIRHVEIKQAGRLVPATLRRVDDQGRASQGELSVAGAVAS